MLLESADRIFQAAILKLTAVCNLDCKYCYMFGLSDRTFTRVPRMMPIETALAVVSQVEKYLESRSARTPFRFVLHGGEPTLWPEGDFSRLLDRIEQLQTGRENISVSLQTNAFRLKPSLMAILSRHKVRIGISIDGPRYYNDRLRTDLVGKGTYNKVMSNVDRLLDAGFEHDIAGFLAVAQPSIPVDEFYEWIEKLPITKLDILWPLHHNYENPPWAGMELDRYKRRPRYGAWFSELFGRWWSRDDPGIYIRHFYDILGQYFGNRGHTDSIVNDVLNAFVVNTDGVIEYPDYFRTNRDGGSRTSYNVFRSEIDDLSADPMFEYCLNMGDYRPRECRRCPHVGVCGGGLLSGRMSGEKEKPLRKSVLCYDHFFFLSRVSEHIRPYVAAQNLQSMAC